jgi:hypothetical protein
MAEEDRLYDYTNQRETGEEHNLYWNNFSKKLTKDQLREQFNAKDNGQLRAAFGDFDNYLAYMDERQNFIDVGLLKADWWDTGVALIDPENVDRELAMDDKALEQSIIDRGVDLATGAYNDQAAILLSLYTKYTGIEGNSWYNSDGDRFEWNGTSYVKTNKIDDSFNVNDTILALGAAGLTAGAINPILGALNKALSAANIGTISATNAQLAVNALTTAIQTGGDPKAIAGSVLGAVVGDYFANNLIKFTGPGSGLIDAAAANAISTAVSQGITNGSLDLNDILTSGLMGAGVAGAGELINSLATGEAFDLDGLISEDSDLYGILNGTDDSAGLLTGIRASFKEFTEKYITGGDWWESATEDYDSVRVSIGEDGKYKTVKITGYDGSITEMPWADYVKLGITKASRTNPFWDLISQAGGAIPDDWLKQLSDWLNGKTSSSGGTYTTEGNTTITTTGTSGDGDGDGDGDGGGEDTDPNECIKLGRVTNADGTCGGCIDTLNTSPEDDSDGMSPCVPYEEPDSNAGEPCVTGAPLNAKGVFDDFGECIPDEGSLCTDANGDGGQIEGGECVAFKGGDEDDGDGTGEGTGGDEGPKVDDPCDSNGDGVEDGTIDKNGNCIPNDPVKTVCNDRNATNYGEEGECTYESTTSSTDPTPAAKCDDLRADNYGEEGECEYAEICLDPQADNYEEGGPCEYSGYVKDNDADYCKDVNCSQKPSEASFAMKTWRACCTRKVTTSKGTNPDDVDCNMVECENPRPAGAMGVVWDKCCTTTTTTTTSTGGETDCTLVECESPRPDGDLGALWDECCKSTTTTTTTTSGGDDGGDSGGLGMLGSLGEDNEVLGFDYTAQVVPGIQAPAQFDATASLDAYVKDRIKNSSPEFKSLFEGLV